MQCKNSCQLFQAFVQSEGVARLHFPGALLLSPLFSYTRKPPLALQSLFKKNALALLLPSPFLRIEEVSYRAISSTFIYHRDRLIASKGGNE